MAPRGIPEVPLLKARTIVDQKGQSHLVLEYSSELRRHLQDMREVVVQLRANQVPPTVPTNVKVTPEAFSNLVQWTRSVNADYYEVLWAPNSNIANAQVVNVGSSAQWTDNVGNSGVTRFYWVRARKNTGAVSNPSNPLSGTTLASNAGVTPPAPPPQSQNQVIDQRTGHIVQQPRGYQLP